MKRKQRSDLLEALKRQSEWRGQELRKRLAYAHHAADAAERKRAEAGRLAQKSAQMLQRVIESGDAVSVDALQRMRAIVHSDQGREERLNEEHRRLGGLAQTLAGEVQAAAVAVRTYERMAMRERHHDRAQAQRDAQHQADEHAAQAATRGQPPCWK